MHHHPTGGLDAGSLLALLIALTIAAAAALYLAGLVRVARRERRLRARAGWRTASWVTGLIAVAGGFVGPLATAARTEPVAHMAAHLLTGMVGPLLLVLAAPVTLALNALPVGAARRLSRVLRSPLLRVLTHPVTAAVLNVGGLWVLYRTPLITAVHASSVIHLLVMTHLTVAGYLFTASVVPVDPTPHRSGFPLRITVLVVSLAAHGVLAKVIYADAPAGLAPAGDADAVRSAAMLMYYGGDLVDAALAVLLCAQWYRAAGRRLDRTRPALRPG